MFNFFVVPKFHLANIVVTHYLKQITLPICQGKTLSCFHKKLRLYLHPLGCLPLPPSIAYGVLYLLPNNIRAFDSR